MRTFAASFAVAAALLLTGCGRQQGNAGGPHQFVATPPHGGTPVALGDDYQIEWVLDAPEGKLQAYVLDGEMENFVRIKPPSFDLTVRLSSGNTNLRLAAVANPATGETVGNTSLFEAQADWLKTTKSFSADIPQINVQGTVFSNITFSFPSAATKEEK